MSERLAIEGGRPIRATLLPYGRQTVDEDDVRHVVEVLRSDWLTTGPTVSEFGQGMPAYRLPLCEGPPPRSTSLGHRVLQYSRSHRPS